MKDTKFFFSPQPEPDTLNKYIVDFYTALSKKVTLINANRKRARSLELLHASFSSDVMILNWPEDILHLRFGLLQLALSLLCVAFFKVRGGKVVWVCHNKDSHYKNYRFLRRLVRKFYTVIANHIIVHSTDALTTFSAYTKKVSFINHPIYESFHFVKDKAENHNDIDILIWGSINTYKGLKEFIENYKRVNCLLDVLIIGKADSIYHKFLSTISQGTNISIVDAILSDQELQAFFERSRIILLPYLDSDTFSSGALIHSLNSRKVVIGPSLGNFKDVENMSACLIYKGYDQLFELLNNLVLDEQAYNAQSERLHAGIMGYAARHTWPTMVDTILDMLTKQQPVQNSTPNLIDEKVFY